MKSMKMIKIVLFILLSAVIVCTACNIGIDNYQNISAGLNENSIYTVQNINYFAPTYQLSNQIVTSSSRPTTLTFSSSKPAIGQLYIRCGKNSPNPSAIIVPAINQKIASFEFEVQNEPIKVGKLSITLANYNTGFDTEKDGRLYKLIDSTGKIWAGPFDAVGSKVLFSFPIVFPVGVTELFLTVNIIPNICGQPPCVVPGIDKIQAGIHNPDTDLMDVRGVNSNQTIRPLPYTSVYGSIMTVKAAYVSVQMASIPVPQYNVIGITQAWIASLIIDTNGSAEDVSFSEITVRAGRNGCWSLANVNNFYNYKLWDGAVQVGETEMFYCSGGEGTGEIRFNIDMGYLVPKNTLRLLKLTADAVNLPLASSTCFYPAGAKALGDTSKTNVIITLVGNDSPKQTWIRHGALKVTLHPNNPPAMQVYAGQKSVPVFAYNLCAMHEAIDITGLNVFAGQSEATDTASAYVSSNVEKFYLFVDNSLKQTTIFGINGKARINFNSTDFTIKKDTCAKVEGLIDAADKQTLKSGSVMYVGLGDLSNSGARWGYHGSYSIEAVGLQSGVIIPSSNIDSVGDGTGMVFGGNRIEMYDGILYAGILANSPNGFATTGIDKEVLVLQLSAKGSDITVLNLEYLKAGTCTITGTGRTKWINRYTNTEYYFWLGSTAWLNNSRGWIGGTAGQPLMIAKDSTVTVSLIGDTNGCTINTTLQFGIMPNFTSSGIVYSDGDSNYIDSSLNGKVTGSASGHMGPVITY